ncbi:MAG: thiamine-phosphate diphosphorylase [Firmicutes bacterium RBG_13_65_8]|nr:MAG: thiamine-phosphate diphosphorylase [Firmicutes bacterium RBG_13_65_8]
MTPDPGPALDQGSVRGICLLARAALDGGVRAVQLRAKSAPAGQLLEVAEELREICDRAGGVLLINDRLDVALAAGAAGVQLGESGLPVEAAAGLIRRVGGVAGNRMMIGASVHSPQGVRERLASGADFVVFGNIFATPSKPGPAGRGLAALEEAVQAAAGRPVVAIGGITAQNAAAVRLAGAAGAAVIGAIAGAADPRAAARELLAGWHGWRKLGR